MLARSFRPSFVVLFGLGAVLLLAPSSAVAQNANMGETYHNLDASVLRVTTWYPDSTAVTVRRAGGVLVTWLYDRAGVQLARLEHRPSENSMRAEVRATGGEVSVSLPSAVRLTADWTNVQVRRMWRDVKATQLVPGGTGNQTEYVWRGRWFRLRAEADREAALKQPPEDPSADIVGVQTDFPGYTAVSSLDRHTLGNPRAAYSTFTCHLRATDGRDLGFVRYFARERVVTWAFKNGQRGVAPEWRLPTGFGFSPNMAWANVQALAFHRSPRPNPQTASNAGSNPAGASRRLLRTMSLAIEQANRALGSLIAEPLLAASPLEIRAPSDSDLGIPPSRGFSKVRLVTACRTVALDFIGWMVRSSETAATGMTSATKLTARAPVQKRLGSCFGEGGPAPSVTSRSSGASFRPHSAAEAEEMAVAEGAVAVLVVIPIHARGATGIGVRLSA